MFDLEPIEKRVMFSSVLSVTSMGPVLSQPRVELAATAVGSKVIYR